MWKFFINSAHAELTGIIPKSKEAGDLGDKFATGELALSDIPLVILHFINLGTKIAGTLAVGFLIYAGFQYILSGITEKKEDAKKTIQYAITGLVVVFLSWIIVNLIQTQLTS